MVSGVLASAGTRGVPDPAPGTPRHFFKSRTTAPPTSAAQPLYAGTPVVLSRAECNKIGAFPFLQRSIQSTAGTTSAHINLHEKRPAKKNPAQRSRAGFFMSGKAQAGNPPARQLHSHTAHTTHAAHATHIAHATPSRLVFSQFSDHAVGGQHQTGDRSSVL